jgi:Zn-dependent membrane protease YugP
MFFLIIIGFMVLSMLAGLALRNRFNAYAKIPLRSGLSGREVAEKMLRENGLYDVQVTCVQGTLTDHYNPMNRTVNLSPEVYSGRSVSAAAVAAHECGHAVQHATAYPFLQFRSAMVPIVQISSNVINFVFIAALFGGAMLGWGSKTALLIVIVAQSFITLFSLITLPVEFDASRRALVWLNSTGLTYGEEHTKATKALSLAALTYVISALAAVTTLLYYVLAYMGRSND